MGKIYNILSTALLPEAALMALSEQQMHCDVIPFIDTEITVSKEEELFIQNLAQQQVIVLFTSTQAVAAVKSCLNNTVPDWQICCISGATKNAVASLFGTEKIIASANDAIDLLQEMEKIAPQRIVFFCGNKRLNTLPEALINRGFQLEECEVYQTKLNALKIEKEYDGILFFSPSGVESFLTENTIPEKATLFSIGKTTAKTLSGKANNDLIIAAQPDKHILVHTLIEFYKNKEK